MLLKMVEVILDLVYTLNLEESTEPLQKLHPKYIEKVSTTLAELICKSFNNDSKSTYQKRYDLVEFLHTLAVQDVNHFSVNKDNLEAVLTWIFPECSQSGQIQFDKLATVVNEEYEGYSESSSLEKIMMFYKKQKSRTQRIRRDKELIRLKDREYVPDIYKTAIQAVHSNVDISPRNECEEIPPLARNSITYKSLKYIVNLGYAIINLQPAYYEKYIYHILNQISAFEKLHSFEINFISYIFEYSSLLDEEEWLFRFPFVYEVPLINIATELLVIENNEDRRKLISNNILKQPLAKICMLADRLTELKCNLMNMFYELLKISKFNNKIFDLINIFK